jgi:uncharacterized protein YfaA (DUF2138 family)
MIVDTPFLSNLAIGADRVIPQDSDGQVIIPFIVNPVITPLFQTNISNLSSDTARGESKLAQLTRTNTNLAAESRGIIIIGKGLYTLQYNLAARSNFSDTVLSSAIALTMIYQGFTIAFANLMLASETGTLEGSRYLLLNGDANIQVSIPRTNAVATDTIALAISVNVMKHL